MITEETKAYIKQNEGLRLKPYTCTMGFPTIGYGHKMSGEEQVKYRNGIDQETADILFNIDAGNAEQGARDLVKNFDELSDPRQRVLIDMAFNLGKLGLSKFKKMLFAVVVGDFSEAAKQLLDSSYASQVKGRANRNAELMERG